jgi:hypothetical protein
MTAPITIDRKPLPAGFLDEVRTVVGERLHTGEAMRLQHGSSETHFEPVLPDAVVFAHSTEEVAALVKLCVAAGVPIIAFGAGTSLEGNVTPIHGGLTIDLSEMNAILEVNQEDFDCTVQARTAQRASARPGAVLPDRPRRQRDDRRHGLDPRLGHQCGALRHDEGRGPLAPGGDARGQGDPHRAARAQVGGGL